MLYWLTIFIVWVAVKFSFKSIRINGKEKLPKDIPIIFISNHPVGFMEPLVISTHLPMQLYYLARGDFFRKPLFRWLLTSIHIYPIYRFRDGFADMRNNESAIQTAIDFVRSGRNFLVFSEGSTKLQHSVRPIQKGVSRIIYDLLLQHPDQKVAIVPIGFNDTEMMQLGSHVIVNIGDPINPKALFVTEPQKPRFLKALTKEMETSMYDLVPQLVDNSDEVLLTELIDLNHKDERPFKLMKSYSDKLNTLPIEDKDALKSKVLGLNSLLENHKSTASGLLHSNTIFSWLTLLLGFIPALVGWIFNGIPFALGTMQAKRKVNKPEFYMVIKMVFKMIFFFLWYVVWFVILKLLDVPHPLIVLVLLIVLAVYYRHYILLAKEKISYLKGASIKEEFKSEKANIESILNA